MNALHLKNNTLTYDTDYPDPKLKEGHAIVQVDLAGICTTDLEIVKGYIPSFASVLGHEWVGTVVETDAHEWRDKRVVASINFGCNECDICLMDGPEHCPERTVMGIINQDGGFAEYVQVPVTNLYEIPDHLSDEAAVFVEPVAAALRIREQLLISPSTPIAVLGPGRLGLLIAQVLALGGAPIIILGRNQKSLELPQQWGFETELVENIADNSFPVVVEATGNQEGFKHALRLVQPRGQLIMKSTFAGDTTINLTKLVVDEITLTGSRCGPFAPAIRLLADNKIDVTSLIEDSYPLSEGVAAFDQAAQPGVRKILLRL